MKKTSKTIQWIFTAIFGMCALANGFHFSTLILLLATILLMPIEPIRNFLKDKAKIKSGIAIALAIILFFIGILNSPLADTPPDISDGSSISSTISDTDSENKVSSSEISSVDDTTSNDGGTSSNTSSTTSDNTVTSQTSSKEETVSSIGTGNATAVKPSDIPNFSGKAYAIINNNIPNFSASELTQKGYEKYSPLDSLGRTQMAIASVGKDTMPAPSEERGSISSIKPSGWIQAKYTNVSGGWLYNRCHLIGCS